MGVPGSRTQMGGLEWFDTFRQEYNIVTILQKKNIQMVLFHEKVHLTQTAMISLV